jgi:serine/threonine protein kinase
LRHLNRGFVWCDIKLDNFVLVSEVPLEERAISTYLGKAPGRNNKLLPYVDLEDVGSYNVKAIDLESAVSEGSPQRDFSAEIIAPEQCALFSMGSLAGGGRDFRLDVEEVPLSSFKSDIWALGISFLEIYYGRQVFTLWTILKQTFDFFLNIKGQS